MVLCPLDVPQMNLSEWTVVEAAVTLEMPLSLSGKLYLRFQWPLTLQLIRITYAALSSGRYAAKNRFN